MIYQIVITYNEENKQVGVGGQIDNKIVAYGMLALAHDIIYDHKPSAIIPAVNIPEVIQRGN